MPKSIAAPFFALFLLASALVLAQAAGLRTRPAVAVESPSVLATVRAYYAAVDFFLETGDMRGVRDVVDPRLLGPIESGDGGIELFLRALRGTYPLVSVSRSVAVVQVDVKAGPAAKFASVRLVNPLSQWHMTESLTVEGSRIVGRQSSGPSLGLVASISEHPVELSRVSPGKLILARLTFDAASDGYVSVPAPAILLVEQGIVWIEGNGVGKVFREDGGPGEVTEPGTDVPAGPGDEIVVEAARVVLSNGEHKPASLLAILVVPEAREPSSRELSVETHLLDAQFVPDGIMVKPFDIWNSPAITGPARITSELIVLTAGGTVELPDDAASAIVQPLLGEARPKRDALTDELALHNPGAAQALVWAVVVD